MEKELHTINIVPARFHEKQGDSYVIACLIGDMVQYRKFEPFSLEGMANPNLLLIGIMTGVGFTQINFAQADEFEDLFKEHWKQLL